MSMEEEPKLPSQVRRTDDVLAEEVDRAAGAGELTGELSPAEQLVRELRESISKNVSKHRSPHSSHMERIREHVTLRTSIAALAGVAALYPAYKIYEYGHPGVEHTNTRGLPQQETDALKHAIDSPTPTNQTSVPENSSKSPSATSTEVAPRIERVRPALARHISIESDKVHIDTKVVTIAGELVDKATNRWQINPPEATVQQLEQAYMWTVRGEPNSLSDKQAEGHPEAEDSTYIYGHTWRNGPGAFNDLQKVQPGDKIHVSTDKGDFTYVVASIGFPQKDKLVENKAYSVERGKLVVVACTLRPDGLPQTNNTVVTAYLQAAHKAAH